MVTKGMVKGLRYVTIKETSPYKFSVSGIFPTKDHAKKGAKMDARHMKKGFVYIARLSNDVITVK